MRFRNFAVAFALCSLLAVPALAQIGGIGLVPPLMSFQGRLTTPSGNPVPDGTYSIRFSVHTAATGGIEVWNQTINSVAVRNGSFAVMLSDLNYITFNTPDSHLQIKIGNDPPLVPRQRVTSVAYALKSAIALKVPDGSITTANIANGAITADKFAPNIFNPLSWLLGGNSGTNPSSHFLGTTDNQPLEFRVNNVRALRIENVREFYNATDYFEGSNTISGYSNNRVASGITAATIAGGGAISVSGQTSGPFNNYVFGSFGTIGGGTSHTAGFAAVVSGGNANDAIGRFSSVGGGQINTASGIFAAIPGGSGNIAHGDWSFAAGRSAKASHSGTFVWSDPSNNPTAFESTGSNQFLIRATGGVGINTNVPRGALEVSGGNAYVTSSTSNVEIGAAGFLEVRATNAQPYIDFSRVAGADYNGRIILADTNTLQLIAPRIVVTGNFVNNSDRRYKNGIMSLDDALDQILALRGVSYQWNRQAFPALRFSEGRQTGFIAQEVESILPDLVSTDKNGYKSVNYIGVIPVLVESVKTLKMQLDDKQRQIDALKKQNAEIAELKAQLSTIMATLREIKAEQDVLKSAPK